MVVVAGLSARAAVSSAEAGGFRVRAVDWFQDLDTRAVVARSCEREGVPFLRETSAPTPDWERIGSLASEMAAKFVNAVVLPTGGIENHLDVLSAWHRDHHCAASSVNAIRCVRDPAWLAACLADLELSYPRTRGIGPDGVVYAVGSEVRPERRNGDGGAWLDKSLASGGGMDIRVCDSSANPARPAVGRVLQQRVRGIAASAAFLSRNGEVEWLGASRQWLGPEHGAATDFGYVGNTEWRDAPEFVQRAVCDGARKIARDAGLVGLFGIDFVVDDHGSPWLIEVNPRWTASLELYERRRGRSFVRDHLVATGVGGEVDRERGTSVLGSVSWGCLGKWTVYARERCVAADLRDDRELAYDMDRGELADIPHPGTEFHRGDPVCTVLAGGANEDACLRELERRADRVRDRLLRVPSASLPTSPAD